MLQSTVEPSRYMPSQSEGFWWKLNVAYKFLALSFISVQRGLITYFRGKTIEQKASARSSFQTIEGYLGERGLAFGRLENHC
jgi:hypothetical protein